MRTNQLARTIGGGARLQRVYSYGTGGDLSGIAYNDSGATPGVTFTYDRLGRRLTAARGSTTSTFHYTAASLPLGESHAGGTLGNWAVTNTFDGSLRRTTVQGTLSGAAQFTQGYGYDTAGRLQTATSGSFSAEYGYHANSPLVSTVSHRYGGNNRMVTTKQYDFINRLSSIANGSSAGFTDSYAYGYNGANQRTNVVRADGSYWVYTYDNLGQVISGKRYWSDHTPVAGQQHEYAFDDIGNRTSAKSGGTSSGTGLRTENYTRNRLNQYTQKDEANTFDVLGLANVSATVTVNGSSAYRKNEYFHKEVSVSNGSVPVWQSVQTIASLGGSTTTNTGNMYVAKTPEVLTYDLDGNQLTDGRWSNTWDAENRLILQETIGTVPTGAKKRLIHEYDWMGRRIRKQVYNWVASAWSLVQDERFLYDGWNVIAILDSATTIQQTMLWGKDLSGSLQGAGGVGGLLAITHYPSAKTYFTGYDGNGNVTVLIDGVSGLIEGNFEYGPFGELIRASGTAIVVCPWRFSTKYEDAETGQLYYGYRYLNPSTGRWLSRDPLGEAGGWNLAGFLGNNGISSIDAVGLDTTIVNPQPLPSDPPSTNPRPRFPGNPSPGDSRTPPRPPPPPAVNRPTCCPRVSPGTAGLAGAGTLAAGGAVLIVATELYLQDYWEDFPDVDSRPLPCPRPKPKTRKQCEDNCQKTYEENNKTKEWLDNCIDKCAKRFPEGHGPNRGNLQPLPDELVPRAHRIKHDMFGETAPIAHWDLKIDPSTGQLWAVPKDGGPPVPGPVPPY